LGETEDGDKLFSDIVSENSERVQRQQKAPLRVISPEIRLIRLVKNLPTTMLKIRNILGLKKD
jgi:hypothetical protein